MDPRDFVDSRNLRHYLEEISKFPALTDEEEKKLGERIRAGDMDAVQTLVKSNLKFVVSYVKKYRGMGLGLLDLIDEGNVGLIEAAKRFDPTEGRPLRLLRRLVDPPGHHPRPDALFARLRHPPEAGRPDLAHETEDRRAQEPPWAASPTGRRSAGPWASPRPTSRTSRSWPRGTCP
ncbi:MAG: hypothetical protein M0C28_04580 [Candidatus Moduliflexus flocculans]|nr:hypothetical protein [Candidatus Moduliflexus flocculans]